MSFLELLDKIDANGRRPIVNSCAREDPVGAAATAIKIAWSLNSRDDCTHMTMLALSPNGNT
jgi:hypothetical protein